MVYPFSRELLAIGRGAQLPSKELERDTGFEPATLSLENSRSTN